MGRKYLTAAPSTSSSLSNPGCACSSSSSSSSSCTSSSGSWCPPKKCNSNCQSFSYPICNNRNSFTSMVTPLNNMTTLNNQSTVGFIMERNGKTITLQWEPFSGSLGANGITHLDVLQSISNLPQSITTFVIYITFKGVGRVVTMIIDPNSINGNIKFYLNTDQSSTGTAVGDSVSVPAGAVTWIVE